MFSDKIFFLKISKIFRVCCHGNHSCKRIQFFSKISEEDHGRIISVKFHQNWIGSFREEDI